MKPEKKTKIIPFFIIQKIVLYYEKHILLDESKYRTYGCERFCVLVLYDHIW